MTTEVRPMKRLKTFFRGVIAGRRAAGRGLEAVVYRRVRGSLAILALEGRKGVCSLPAGRAQPGETDEEALGRIVAAASGLDPEELKVWQSLGLRRSGQTDGAKEDPANCFLVQSLAAPDLPAPEKGRPAAAWRPVEAVLERADAGTAEMVMLAVAKLKRAQI